MSSGELRRVETLARVSSKDLKLIDAAEMLGVSYRQAKRLWKRYREQGAEGLKHGNAGRESNRAKPEWFRRQVLGLIRKKYGGPVGERFGPTLAAEHLGSEDRLEVDAETLRRWMLEEGLWSRERKRPPHRQRRERKAHRGELVQMDGSFAEWLEKRGPGGCLMDMVDDATSVTMSRLGSQETIWAAAGVLRAWIEEHGVPLALYTDWKNVYVREPNAKERISGEVPLTQFGAMCARLQMRIRSQFGASQRASGAQSRDAPRPADQEDAAEEDRDARGGEPVSGRGVPAGTQPAVRADAGGGGGLSPSAADEAGVG